VKQTPYETARDALTVLEHESATIDKAIKDAGLHGDFVAVVHHMARKQVLPALLDVARRTLAPLELEHLDAEIARLTAESLPERVTLETAAAAFEQARANLQQAQGFMDMVNADVRELHMQHRTVWRRVEYYAAQPETPPAYENGKVVRSLWQAVSE
jgi:hypothetical protein